jgi:hypothetical protein
MLMHCNGGGEQAWASLKSEMVLRRTTPTDFEEKKDTTATGKRLGLPWVYLGFTCCGTEGYRGREKAERDVSHSAAHWFS